MPREEHFVEMIAPPQVNLSRLRRRRLQRIREQMRARDIPLCIIFSPTNLRYAIDFREYPFFQSHIPMVHLLLPAAGPVTLCGATHQGYAGVDDYRAGIACNPFDRGLDFGADCAKFARQVRDFLREIGAHDAAPKVAIEAAPAGIFQALSDAGVRVIGAEALLDQARMIKSEDEFVCIKHAVAVAELAIRRMQNATKPGISENQLWSILHQVNIAHDGDWSEGRMLASGARTNPWLQEASDKKVAAGELVGLDTDMVGPFGYCADISRTWLCGDKPDAAQREAYRHAWEEVQHNIGEIKPGVTFGDLLARIYPRRKKYIARRYVCAFHGVGMSDEYPKIYYPEDADKFYDGVIQTDMLMCVESFSGAAHGDGVKLEQMVRVTDNGAQLISNYPFEENLL